jgi:hypothetical protein
MGEHLQLEGERKSGKTAQDKTGDEEKHHEPETKQRRA